MTELQRPDNRAADELRPLSYELDIAPHASGSLLLGFGKTRVICSAILERKIPGWMRAQGIDGGWITAEYSMLPYSTLDRKNRDINRGKQDGRSIEIQRLIGRSLRAVTDLSLLPGYTLWLDCDVLQADGGTRTASITGAYIAAAIAVNRLIAEGKLEKSPLKTSVAAISAGVWKGQPILDLCYEEDRDASVDANIVMTGEGAFVEYQASGEEAVFSTNEMNALTALASKGIQELSNFQEKIITEAKS
ncbi:MAG: ribonuclease PH [Opitutales bacterium]|nr:ribonuclease PH [Opitutales bacterium]